MSHNSIKTFLLIDANALIHRAFHALPEMTGPQGNPTQALYGVASILLKVWREEKPDYAAALFDRPEPTFRKEEFREYKAHRPQAPDELISQIIEARNLFKAFGIVAFELPGFEADDLIGTLVYRFKETEGIKIIILTGDLDTLQLVLGEKVVVKTLKTGVSTTVLYDEQAVLDRYGLPPPMLPDFKALTGDPSDNIPGIHGIGPKTASELLRKYGTLETLIDSIPKSLKYKEKFEGKEQKLELYRRLALIRHDVPLPEIELRALSTIALPLSLLDYFDRLGFKSLKKRLVGGGIIGDLSGPVVEHSLAGRLFSEEPERLVGRAKNILILYQGRELQFEELTSSRIKIGFELKDVIKNARRKKITPAGPYFDLGVGFWVCYPDFKNYLPQTLFPKFLRREWSGTREDYETAYLFLQNEIQKNNLTKVFSGIEMPLLEVLASMEERGVKIDRQQLFALRSEINSELRKLTDTIYGFIGEEINLNSPRELGKLLFEKLKIAPSRKRTPKGWLSTNEEVLLEHRNKHPAITPILSYRELFKLQSTYVKPILALLEARDRLRTTYIQTGTATGRLSSQKPNLQNIPVGGRWADKLRSVFVPEAGFSLVSFDYSQIELRILASLSDDSKMINSFLRGEDIHTATAKAVFKLPADKITSEMRRLAKTLNFGVIYGMGARAFAKTAGIKLEEAQSFIGEYFKEFAAIRWWQEQVKDEAQNSGLVRNLNGRFRRVPGIFSGTSRAASGAERIAINMPVQSLGADIIKLAMIKISDVLKEKTSWREKVFLILSIHDELLFEVRDDMIVEVVPILRKIMESVFALKVPLLVNVKRGNNLAELF